MVKESDRKSDEHSRAQDSIRRLLDYCTLPAVRYVHDTIEEAVTLAPLRADEHLSEKFESERIETKLARDMTIIHDGILTRWDSHTAHLVAEFFRRGCPSPVFGRSESEKRAIRRRRWRLSMTVAAAIVMSLVLGMGWANAARQGRIDHERAAALNAKMHRIASAGRGIARMTEVLATRESQNKDEWATVMNELTRMLADLQRSTTNGEEEN